MAIVLTPDIGRSEWLVKKKYTLNKPNDNVHTFLTHYAALWLHYSIFLGVVAKHLKNRHLLVLTFLVIMPPLP